MKLLFPIILTAAACFSEGICDYRGDYFSVRCDERIHTPRGSRVADITVVEIAGAPAESAEVKVKSNGGRTQVKMVPLTNGGAVVNFPGTEYDSVNVRYFKEVQK